MLRGSSEIPSRTSSREISRPSDGGPSPARKLRRARFTASPGRLGFPCSPPPQLLAISAEAPAAVRGRVALDSRSHTVRRPAVHRRPGRRADGSLREAFSSDPRWSAFWLTRPGGVRCLAGYAVLTRHLLRLRDQFLRCPVDRRGAQQEDKVGMRRSRVISCLASSTQQMNSFRARGVMSFQASSAVGLATSSAVGLAISALRRSAGSLCTTPPGTRWLLTGPR
jgi:hypothetical protein